MPQDGVAAAAAAGGGPGRVERLRSRFPRLGKVGEQPRHDVARPPVFLRFQAFGKPRHVEREQVELQKVGFLVIQIGWALVQILVMPFICHLKLQPRSKEYFIHRSCARDEYET